MQKLYNEQNVQDIADAIRDRNRTNKPYKLKEMSQGILDLPRQDLYNVLLNKQKTTIVEGKSLTLNQCINMPIKNLEIKGVSRQYGETLPNNPNKIKNLKGYNLFNINNYSRDKTDRVTLAFDISNLLIGETYTITFAKPVQGIKISDTRQGYNSVTTSDDNGFSKYTFIMSRSSDISASETQYLYIRLLPKNWVTEIEQLKGYDVQIVNGTEEKTYMPYNQIAIKQIFEDEIINSFKISLEEQKLMEGSYFTDTSINHNRKQIVIDGVNIKASSVIKYGNNYRFTITPSNYNIYYNGEEINCLSDRFEANWSNVVGNVELTTKPCFFAHRTGILIVMTPEYNIKTVAEFNTWASNHPITVEYKTNQEIIVPYTAEQQEIYNKIKKIELCEGTNIIAVDAYEEPDMKAEYYVDAIEIEIKKYIDAAIGGEY